MKAQTIIDTKSGKGLTEIVISPKDLSNIIEQFAKDYYINRKDYGAVTIKQLIKDIVKAEPEIKLYTESNISIEEFNRGIAQ